MLRAPKTSGSLLKKYEIMNIPAIMVARTTGFDAPVAKQ